MDGGINYEIRIGRVLMMNPGYLLSAGAERHCLDNVKPPGGYSPHYFLCIGVVGNNSFRRPLSSHRKNDGSALQGTITKQYKDGYNYFTNTDSWSDKGQNWKIPNARVQHYAGVYDNHNKEQRDGNLNAVTPAITEAIFCDMYPDFGIAQNASNEIIGRAKLALSIQ